MNHTIWAESKLPFVLVRHLLPVLGSVAGSKQPCTLITCSGIQQAQVANSGIHEEGYVRKGLKDLAQSCIGAIFFVYSPCIQLALLGGL